MTFSSIQSWLIRLRASGAETAKMGKASDPGRRAAFTLLEMMAVIAILAVISVSAMLAVRRPIANARQQLVLARIQWLDGIARDRAARWGRAILSIDVEHGTIAVRSGNDTASAVTQYAFEVHPSVQVDTVICNHANSNGNVYRINYDRFGHCPTYGVQLSARSNRKWILMLGLTGQAYELDERDTIDKVIAGERNDAH